LAQITKCEVQNVEKAHDDDPPNFTNQHENLTARFRVISWISFLEYVPDCVDGPIKQTLADDFGAGCPQ